MLAWARGAARRRGWCAPRLLLPAPTSRRCVWCVGAAGAAPTGRDGQCQEEPHCGRWDSSGPPRPRPTTSALASTPTTSNPTPIPALDFVSTPRPHHPHHHIAQVCQRVLNHPVVSEDTYCLGLTAKGELLGEGGRNAKGEEDGRGTMVYANGSVYDGQWRAGKRHGHGKHTLATGEVYEGEFVTGKRHGAATQTLADGRLVVSRYEADAKVERGVIWSADRAAAWELQEGVEARCISLDEADQIAAQIVNGSPLPHRASAWEPSVVLDGNGMPELPDRT